MGAGKTMTKEQLEPFQLVVIAISIVSIIIGIIIWFIFIVQADVSKTRFKHETCMVETTTSTINDTVTVIEYCGPNNKELPK
jgi:hypothetical protein